MSYICKRHDKTYHLRYPNPTAGSPCLTYNVCVSVYVCVCVRVRVYVSVCVEQCHRLPMSTHVCVYVH